MSSVNSSQHADIPVSQLRTSKPAEVNDDNDEPERLFYPPTMTPKSLPGLLQILFGLNGLTLALESLSLMYIVNTRVGIPLPYLPTYGAIAFLPYSLKPLYGYLSQGTKSLPRHLLFVALLTTNAFVILLTCLIPPGGVVLAFAVAFLRGITDSWAEFCLGLTLIDHARTTQQQQQDSFDNTASHFQSQAATARNFGALLGSLVTCLLVVERTLVSPDQLQLNGAVANALLITTGLLQIVGAISAYVYRNDFLPSPSATSFSLIVQQEDAIVDEESALRDDEDSHPSYSSQEDSNDADSLYSTSSLNSSEARTTMYHSRANWTLILLLQLIIILFAMKGPISEWASHVVWKVIMVSLLLAIAIMGLAMYSNDWWQKSHRVGLFLILRQAIPSDTMLVASFFYSVFQSTPLLLQLLSLASMAMTTLSSWSYGKLWSRFTDGRAFLLVIAGTTLLAALASLGNIVVFQNSSSHWIFWISLAFKAVTAFFSEWAFLPDVILATTSVTVGQKEDPQRVTNLAEVLPPSSSFSNDEQETTKNIAIEYGTLISCIDFGDQLGSLVTGPIVAMLGISRENHFLHLDRLVLLCSLFSVLSLGLLAILRKR
jgi:hypothetical protein